ncbi:hypothetical protein [Shimazuella kribbensis]|uniref:hypothetical protein n=1 Tax=Shimazuella kribbensis TaxID=139808 RepID=UPI00048EB484|nr:hypothetical protein [Shimazuella kribbensis]
MRYGHGELDESMKTYTLDHGQATFQGSRITWTNRSGFRLHNVTYDLILPKNIKLGDNGEWIPEIPRGCTRICGRAESLKVYGYALVGEEWKYSDLKLRLDPRKYWDVLFSNEEHPDRFTSIWETHTR